MSEDIKTENKEESVKPEVKAESKPEVKTETRREDTRNTRKPYNRQGGDRVNMQRMPRFRKKVCRFCVNKDLKVDYKKSDILEKYLTDRGKILPRRITGTCAKHQRHVAAEIKKARMIALLPFVEQ